MRDCPRLMRELYDRIRSEAVICNIFICVLGNKKEKRNRNPLIMLGVLEISNN